MYSWKDRLIDWVNQRGAWTHILVAVGITLLITAIILGAVMPSRSVVNTNKVDIGGLKTTMSTVVDGLATKASQEELDSLSGEVADALNDYEGDINDFGIRMSAAENGISEARTDITDIQGDLAELSNSPPEGYLTGTYGNYTLHIESSEASFRRAV